MSLGTAFEFDLDRIAFELLFVEHLFELGRSEFSGIFRLGIELFFECLLLETVLGKQFCQTAQLGGVFGVVGSETELFAELLDLAVFVGELGEQHLSGLFVESDAGTSGVSGDHSGHHREHR